MGMGMGEGWERDGRGMERGRGMGGWERGRDEGDDGRDGMRMKTSKKNVVLSMGIQIFDFDF